MEIPYTVTVRPDTGLTNGRIGTWLFLASEVMLFGALFAAYVMLRAGASQWPRGGELLAVPTGAINTALLVTSGVTMVVARRALRAKRFDRFRVFMGATVLLGLAFLAGRYVELFATFDRRLFASTSTFMAIYVAMTGVHALHVAGGIAVNGYLVLPGAGLWKRDPQWFANRVDNAGLYWQFVGLVWIALFVVFYLL